MTPTELERQEIFDECMPRLAEMAERFVNVLKYHPSQGAMVAIHVDDPAWTLMAETLMPGQDWKQYRDRGEKPVARGSVLWSTVEVICQLVPDIDGILEEPPPTGHLYALVLAGGGAAVYTVPHTGQS